MDSIKTRLGELRRQYRGHLLADTVFLKKVDSAAPYLEGEDSLQEWLAEYREAAFGSDRLLRYQANYYTYLSINAYNRSRFGSAIYWSEKNNATRIRAGMFEKGGLAHSDLFAMTVYGNNKNYVRVFSKYAALRPALEQLPALVGKGSASPEQLYVGLSILQTVTYASCRVGDMERVAECIRTADAILEEAKKKPAKYGASGLVYDYIQSYMLFEQAWFAHSPAEAVSWLQRAVGDVTTKGFNPVLQSAYTEGIYSDAVDFFFDIGKSDSARRYITLLEALDSGNVSYSSLDAGFLQEARSKLMAQQGRYKEAYDALATVYRQRDSSFYAVSSDKDNNLYALAEAEDARSELYRVEETKRLAERDNIFLFFIVALLALGGTSVFLMYRSEQRRKMLEMQLHFARNFHDEVGPMLLYTGMLIRKEAEERPSPRLEEVKGQIGRVMETVREIAHELKSGHPGSVALLAKEMETILEKIRTAAGIDYTLKIEGGHRLIGPLPYIQLKAVMQELVSNTIKHSNGHHIRLELTAEEKTLEFSYSDDGPGWDPAVPKEGIGVANMRERVDALRGKFIINNRYPEGYSIDITIPLV